MISLKVMKDLLLQLADKAGEEIQRRALQIELQKKNRWKRRVLDLVTGAIADVGIIGLQTLVSSFLSKFTQTKNYELPFTTLNPN